MNIDKQKFAQYMKTKEAFLKIYAASFNPTDKAFIALSYEECKLLMKLFDEKEVEGFIV